MGNRSLGLLRWSVVLLVILKRNPKVKVMDGHINPDNDQPGLDAAVARLVHSGFDHCGLSLPGTLDITDVVAWRATSDASALFSPTGGLGGRSHFLLVGGA